MDKYDFHAKYADHSAEAVILRGIIGIIVIYSLLGYVAYTNYFN